MRQPFQVEVDEGCQRGLHLRFHFADRVPDELCETVLARFDDAFAGWEALGARTVRRVIVPFRFELRWGHADAELSLILRFSATPEERVLDQRSVEQLVTQLCTCELAA